VRSWSFAGQQIARHGIVAGGDESVSDDARKLAGNEDHRSHRW
jgi:hypothetical protein